MPASGPAAVRRAASRLALVVALALAVPLLAAGPAGAAGPWEQVRDVGFEGKSLPTGCGAYDGPYPGGQSYWRPDDVGVSGGLLRLRLRQRTFGGRPFTSGGLGCWDWAQTYGRYEIRAKPPAGKGIDSYITLWPAKGGDGSWTGVEVLASGPETAYVTNGYGTGTDRLSRHGLFSDRFHVYVLEWTPTSTKVTVDGTTIFSSPRSFRGKRWFGLVVSNGDRLTGVPDASTKLPAEFQVDYVRVSRWTGSTAAPPLPTAAPTPSPTPAATLTASPTPSPSASATAADALQPVASETALAGGVWPWLLGGSVIAVLAIALLGRPRRPRGD